MARAVCMYVVCSDEQALEIAEKLHNIVLGYGLDGFESGLSMEPRDDEEIVVFTVDDDE